MDPNTARDLAQSIHGDQRDRSGGLLVDHLERVAAAVPADSRPVAFLHDVLEHSDTPASELEREGLTPVELAALRRRREIDDRLAELVSAAAAEGSLRADLPPDLVSRLLFGMVNSLVEWYRPGGPVDAGMLADALATLAFEGLNTRAP